MKRKRLTAFIIASVMLLAAIPARMRDTAHAAGGEEKYSAENYAEVLTATLEQLAVNVPAPGFGTGSGEWSVLALARGGYFKPGDAYFEKYYDRIVGTVKKLAAEVGMNGALDKRKSTENSRLILALSAIGKNAENVGGVDLVDAFSANDFDKWLAYQGINGPIFALIALDTWGYETRDAKVRAECVGYILDHELDGGGWSLTGAGSADPDITAMALQALVNYSDDAKVMSAVERAFGLLSSKQLEDGGFASWESVNSESIAQVIVACTAWGIDPNTDPRFVKPGGSAVDALLRFYVEKDRGFAHVLIDTAGYVGGQVNAMSTDQAAYALAAYDRFVKKLAPLYDMRDTMPKAEGGGDINLDGRVTAQDALMALRGSMGILKLDAEQTARGDVDGSGSITLNDALSILRTALQSA